MSANSTLLTLFARRVRDDESRPALQVSHDGKYRAVTWGELADRVRRLAAALSGTLGVQPGDRVVQLSENRLEWIVSDLAIQMAGAVHVPVHAPLTGPQIAWQIRHSGARVAFVSTADQAAKLVAVQQQLPESVQWIGYERDLPQLGGRLATHVDELIERARSADAAATEERALSAVTPESLVTILYTSGTTGEPKGVMLDQRNLVSNTLAVVEMFGESADEVRLAFLPLSHIFARTCDLYTWLATGMQLALARARETVIEDCATIRPTLLNGVPYFFDKLHRVLVQRQLADTPGSLRELLGGRIRRCCSGGAALPDHVYDFFQQQQVPLLQGYGLSETSPVITVSTESSCRRGTVGRSVPGVEVRIAEDGEILTRGPHVMRGYWQAPEATEQILRDGWLHTGDLGHLDEDGYLKITGRKKEILVTAGGKNVAPVQLESLLCEDPLIQQAVVVGDGRNYLAALIVPDPDALRSEIQQRGIAVTSREQALVHPDVRTLYRQRIDQRLSGVSHYEQIGAFTILGRGFTIESGELTPKLSLRRGEIEKHCAAEIAAMYASDGPN